MNFEWDENNSKMEDDLQPEYDLKSLKVRELGAKRKSFGTTTVHLEGDRAGNEHT